MKVRQPGEPIISSSFIARAVTYYTGSMPAGVIFFPSTEEQLQPYFTPHPPLHMLRHASGAKEFASKYPSVLCIFLLRDVAHCEADASPLKGCMEKLATIGDRVLLRIKGAP